MPSALMARKRPRGERIDDVIPDDSDGRRLSSPYPSWPVTDKPVSDYWHRLTLPGKRKLLACDCKAEFDSAVDLERHQHAYRHPTPLHAR